MDKQNYIKITILLILIILIYFPTFVWMVDRWTATDTYYGHGFLVPLICTYIVWRRREKLMKLRASPSRLGGWLFFTFGIFIHTVSALWRIYFCSGFSLILVLIGLILLFLGKDFLKELLFPILFIIFMIPIPLVSISSLTFKLKILASQLAVNTLNWLGIHTSREGTVIKTAHSYLVIEDPCSGMRSLIALIALAVLMAYFSNISKMKKILLCLSTIPIAIVANVIRIAILTLISEIYGIRIATGITHNIMGIFMFVFAFLGLFLTQKVLEDEK